MERLQVMASSTRNGWKCIAGCFGICLADVASPVLDAAGFALGAISGNA